MAWYRPWKGRKKYMSYTLFCCNLDQPCKVYEMPSRKAWKRLYFLNSCAICGKSIATIWECSMDGTLRLVVRKSGVRAVELMNKIVSKKIKEFRVAVGSANNEMVYYNNKGVVYNFNNRRISSQDKFLKNTHS